jgi:hypothetical protein
MSRILCQFSCGAASAVATQLTLREYGGGPREVLIINAFIVEEDADNRRFLADCEKWFQHPVTVLRDEKYGASIDEVFRKRRFMKGPHGAPCSMELKRKVLNEMLQPNDALVFGYTVEEMDRLDDFRDHYPERQVLAPLIERGLTKNDCLAIIERAGIELPFMYRAGFENANCPGCVKGGEGYWNRVRDVFPLVFEQRMKRQEEIGPGAYFFRNRKTGERFGLKDLRVGAGRHNEPAPSCSFFCEQVEYELGPPEALEGHRSA